MSVRADFHTHSVASADGSLTLEHFRRMLKDGRLDAIAITDHDGVGFAQTAHEQLGPRIIVGEEVSTLEGELIGLFLQQAVPPGKPALATAQAIHDQGGLVYVPHPFETVRKGLPLRVLDEIAGEIDIVEVHNGRAVFQNRSAQARAWARQHGKAQAASSDAHGWHGWGNTYTELAEAPRRDTLVRMLTEARHDHGRVGARGILYPKFNRLRKKLG